MERFYIVYILVFATPWSFVANNNEPQEEDDIRYEEVAKAIGKFKIRRH